MVECAAQECEGPSMHYSESELFERGSPEKGLYEQQLGLSLDFHSELGSLRDFRCVRG